MECAVILNHQFFHLKKFTNIRGQISLVRSISCYVGVLTASEYFSYNIYLFIYIVIHYNFNKNISKYEYFNFVSIYWLNQKFTEELSGAADQF